MLILDITLLIALPPASAFIPTPAIAADNATMSFSANPTVVPVPDNLSIKLDISDSCAAMLFPKFTIVEPSFSKFLVLCFIPVTLAKRAIAVEASSIDMFVATPI
ncbi:hypothetical protein vBSscSF1_2 [Staphylococcus phage vB-SscS-F1]|nr:hypothetical protein vBApySJF1_2 [Arcanobacterium phage vB-ApyS-JF1]